MKILPIALLSFAFLLGGCYTQLATRGQYARGQAPAYGPEAAPSDSLAGDSALAAARGPTPAADTLAPPVGAPTVIVQNYYDPHPYHRGYAHWEWEYPLLSFGYYSSYHGRYSRPYWWDDPWYSRRPVHRRPHGRDPIYVPGRPSEPSGPYQSEKRLFNPDPAYKPVRKGRRSEAPVSAPVQAAPAPKEGSSSGNGSPSGSGTSGSAPESGGTGSSETRKQETEDDAKKEYRRLEKGRRR